MILRSIDAGRTWKQVDGPDDLLRFKFLGLFMGPGDSGVIAGTHGIVLFVQGDQIDFAPMAQKVSKGELK